MKGKALWPTCYKCVAGTYSHPNSPFLASSHAPFRQRQTRASRVIYNEQLRWLDWISLGEYLPRLSINYVGMSKDMGKRLPQLYYIMMKISYDLGFIAIGVAMAT